MKILIVDDDKTIRVLLSISLELDGYTILEAADGYEALQVLENAKPDLIILDLMMPVMDGLDFLRHLRDNKALSDIPVIGLTGMATTQTRSDLISLGVHDVLFKPVNPKVLQDTIKNIFKENQIERD